MRRWASATSLRYLDCSRPNCWARATASPRPSICASALAERAMPPRHALDVLTAFRMDVTKLRYANWDELIDYCRYSAMPVGRFMLDVHGESTSTWAASDALCAGLQINNHLQDCGKDYRDLDRVYMPRDALAAAGATVEELGQARGAGAAAAMPARACGRDRGAARRERIAHRRGRGFPARARDLGDPGFRRQDRRTARRCAIRSSERVHLGAARIAGL